MLKLSLFILLTFNIIINDLTANSDEVKIIIKVNNQIITNLDVINEQKYLLSLNENLKNLNEDQLFTISKDSILKEKIKLSEIKKFYLLGKKNPQIENNIIRIYENIGIDNMQNFKDYLKNKGLNYNEVYKKIEIETLWNQLIYTKFNKRILINKKKKKKKILDNKKQVKQLKFSEILFSFETKDQINKIYNEILKDYENDSFSNIVIKYSISDSAQNSGQLDWVNESILSDQIKDKIKNLKIGEISEPIIIASGALLLKLDDIKFVDEEIDLKKEIDKSINYEINSQLDNYSLIYFSKIRNNLIINEY